MENIGLLIYIYSIYDNVKHVLDNIPPMAFLYAVILAFYCGMVNVTGNCKLFDIFKKYFPLKTIIFLIIINILLPKDKNDLLMIFGAKPTVEFIKDSYENGKLKKVSEITDAALDKALDKLKEK